MKPILFNTEMVRAILEGRKTVTRRVIKPQPTYSPNDGFTWKGAAYGTDLPPTIKGAGYCLSRCVAPYEINDILYVRETWIPKESEENGKLVKGFAYKADFTGYESMFAWRPSIHMPKEAARIFLKVTDVRVERLHDMKLIDYLAEGISNPCDTCKRFPFDECDTCGREGTIGLRFAALWDSTIKADHEHYCYTANPYVWVIEFERVEKPAAD